ncbi:reticulon-like protein B18 [Phalaenopsis equestris]|uniref:reticulon-like protein B18 n=1 Tax=Phalaenopsis equestris TaxID=78828 RepID=UPI0009E35D65|nr:reticulon-like protein B18 [Phalaenopsis equestris]
MCSLPPTPAMDSSTPNTPPTLKSQPRLRSRCIPHLSNPFDDQIENQTLTSPSPRKNPSPLQFPIHELLLPSPPKPRPKLRYIAEETHDLPPSEATPRRKSKNRGLAAPISPRNGRRARRRLEKENVREEKVFSQVEDEGRKLKKRKQSRPRPARKEAQSLIRSLPCSCSKTDQDYIALDDQSSLERFCKAVSDLLMWKNVAKSGLWFGSGSILFLSSIFSCDVAFSIISAASHLGILILALAFFSDSIRKIKQDKEKTRKLQLTEEDVLRIIRVVLPVVNAALSKSEETFSGEPLMTLKVAPVLLFMAKYGHFTTPWRLLAIGFFSSFTVPKFYSCYNQQIQQRVEEAKSYVLESWRSCSRKKLVVISVAALLWNIFSIKMRMFAAFIAVVILRYHHEQWPHIQEFEAEENVNEESREEEQEEPGKENNKTQAMAFTD